MNRILLVCFLAFVLVFSPVSGFPPVNRATANSFPAAACQKTWRVLDQPPEGLFYESRSVSTISADNVWAVARYAPGFGSTSLHWNGTSWEEVKTVQSQDYYETLRGIAAVSPNDVWTVGSSTESSTYLTRTHIEHWKDGQWSVVPSPNDVTTGQYFNQLQGLVPIDANNIWAVGFATDFDAEDYALAPVIMRWDGTQWGLTSTPDGPLSGGKLNAVDGHTTNDIWAVGERDTNGNSRTLTEHWNGTSWEIVPSPNLGQVSNELRDVAVVSSNDVWAVGISDQDSGQLSAQSIILRWNGVEWSSVSHPVVGAYPQFLSSIYAASADDVWAVGHYTDLITDRLLVMHWDGAKWSVVPLAGETSGKFYAIDGILSSDIWAVGTNPNVEGGWLNVSAQLTGWTIDRPKLLSPVARAKITKKRPVLTWEADSCATYYQAELREKNSRGTLVAKEAYLSLAKYKTPKLESGKKYWWSVRACNEMRCALPSFRIFRIR